jgi:hypothetical protein
VAALGEVDAPASLKEMASTLEKDLDDVRAKLGAGGGGFGGGAGDGPRTVRQLLQFAGGVHRATALPTAQEREALGRAPAALDAQVERLNQLVNDRVPAFFGALDGADVPWTPGRPIR